MNLYRELLLRILENERCEVVFPDIEKGLSQLVEMKSYEMLKKILAIIRDDSLDDGDCFMRIEEIICLFEENGCSCKGRHDF